MKWSERITNLLIESNTIAECDKDIYVFCFQYIFDQLSYIVILLIISGILGEFSVGLIILMVSIPLRSFAGGIHASSRLVCSIVTYGSDILILLLCPFIVFNSQIFVLFAVLFLFIVSILLGPVPPPNKMLPDTQLQHMKYNLCKSCIILLSIFFILFMLEKTLLCNTFFIILVFMVLLQATGYLYNRINNK